MLGSWTMECSREPGELGQVQIESAEHGEGEVIACLLT